MSKRHSVAWPSYPWADTFLHVVKKQPATVRTVREWSKEVSVVLQDFLETMDWKAHYEAHGEDIDTLTDCITECINVDNS